MVDRLAALKVNQLQLYTEHTFAYRDHPDVHRAASPFTAAEIVELDAYCLARHVELVPNQNCLGHMNRWLAHGPLPVPGHRPRRVRRPVRDVASAHDRRTHRPGLARPGPGAVGRTPATCSPSRRVHVGLDEAWELPRERIDDYLDWVATLRGLPELDGREMLIWGGMVAGEPDLLARLPDGVTVCEWGYDDWHPFDEADAPPWPMPESRSGWHRARRAG